MILVARGKYGRVETGRFANGRFVNIHPIALSDSLDLKVSQPLMIICKYRGCMEVQIQLSTDDSECY